MKRAVLFALSLFCLPAHAAQTTFECDFDGYEKSERYFQLMEKAGDFYSESFGLGHYGDDDIHERLREAAAELTLDPERTPVVSADFATGRLSVSYCAARRCTLEETNYSAIKGCMAELGAQTCRLYAIRAGETLVCTVMPSLKRQ